MSALMRRKVTDFERNTRVRRVWRSQVKVGTNPGTIGLFLEEPRVGAVVQFVDLGNGGGPYTPARRVTVERYDDVLDRWFVALR